MVSKPIQEWKTFLEGSPAYISIQIDDLVHKETSGPYGRDVIWWNALHGVRNHSWPVLEHCEKLLRLRGEVDQRPLLMTRAQSGTPIGRRPV